MIDINTPPVAIIEESESPIRNTKGLKSPRFFSMPETGTKLYTEKQLIMMYQKGLEDGKHSVS